MSRDWATRWQDVYYYGHDECDFRTVKMVYGPTNITILEATQRSSCGCEKILTTNNTADEFLLIRTNFDEDLILGYDFRDIDWPDRLNKSGSALSQSEGQMLIDIMNDHGFEQLVHFPTREKNTLDLLLTSLPGQFQDIHSPDKLSDHDIVAGTLKIVISPHKETSEKGVYQKGDYESMKKDAFEFAKEKYFNGFPDTR